MKLIAEAGEDPPPGDDEKGAPTWLALLALSLGVGGLLLGGIALGKPGSA